MANESPKHARMCGTVVRALLKEGFRKDEILLSHGCGGVLSKKPGRVALYRLEGPEEKGRANRIKEPDITAKKDDTRLFVEIETQDSPRVAVGDLCCIDVSTHVCNRSDEDPQCLDSCLAIIVHDDFGPNSKKGEQFKRLEEGLKFCGAIKDFRICTVSRFRDSLKDLLEKNLTTGHKKSKRPQVDDSMSPEDLEEVEDILDYGFRDRSLLIRALTHPTFAEEQKRVNPECRHQGALATLGDGVLKAALTEYHFNMSGGEKGEITMLRERSEKNKYLAGIAEDENIPAYLRAGHGATEQGDIEGEKALSDTIEALIGAVFLDCNYRTAGDVALRLLRVTNLQ